MVSTVQWFRVMSIASKLIQIRHERSLTQHQMADLVDLHVNQIRRYEAGSAQPSLEALKKIARALSVSLDFLVFDEDERGPDEELKLQFEAISQFSAEEKAVARTVLDSLILRHTANRFSQAS